MGKHIPGKPTLAKRRRFGARLAAFRRDDAGATAVEFGFIAFAFILLLTGILQFALAFMAQMFLHDAVSEAATGNTAAAYSGNRGQLVTQICDRVIALDSCETRLLVENQPLASYPTSAQPIAGAAFVAATAKTLMMIRAKAPVVTFVPGLSQLHVSAAAIYVRP